MGDPTPPYRSPFPDRLSDFTADRRMLVLSAMAVVVGAVAALLAYALSWLVGTITNLVFFQRWDHHLVSPAGNHLGYWIVLVPVVGGLVIGVMARYGSEKIRGHGIPEALQSILVGGSKVEPKVTLLKPASAAISIGTGGPFGAEGPIIMTGGASGSLFAQFFELSAAERKILLVAGATAGMAATFGTPLAAILLGVELLLFEWKPRSLVPVGVACVVASVLRVPLLGAGPLFPLPDHEALPWWGLLVAAGIGIAGGLLSGLLTEMVYFFEDAFLKLPIHWMWWPAIGGLVIGLGGLVDPRALGVGYDVIGLLLAGKLVGIAMLSLLATKAIIWSFSLGSGTSGGVLAPLLMMGAALGALASGLIPIGTPGVWALIGMAAMMGGTMRVPFTGTFFALELTHEWSLALPLFVGCVSAYALTVLVLRRSILTEKVARAGHHVMREYIVDPLEMLRVGEVMTPEVQALPANMPVADAIDFFNDKEKVPGSRPRTHQGYPVVDAERRVVTMVTQGDVDRWMARGYPPGATLGDMRPPAGRVVSATPDEPANRAAERMAEARIGRLPVLHPETGVLLGIVSRSDLLEGRLRHLVEETNRERVLHTGVAVLRDRYMGKA
jgi:H+/Cl- antiporter ClcA/CBS domain-containing protein